MAKKLNTCVESLLDPQHYEIAEGEGGVVITYYIEPNNIKESFVLLHYDKFNGVLKLTNEKITIAELQYALALLQKVINV